MRIYLQLLPVIPRQPHQADFCKCLHVLCTGCSFHGEPTQEAAAAHDWDYRVRLAPHKDSICAVILVHQGPARLPVTVNRILQAAALKQAP